jgi:hypothetical protein
MSNKKKRKFEILIRFSNKKKAKNPLPFPIYLKKTPVRPNLQEAGIYSTK